MNDLKDLFIGISTRLKKRTRKLDNSNSLRIVFDTSFQRVKRSFFFAFDHTYTKNNDVVTDSPKRV